MEKKKNTEGLEQSLHWKKKPGFDSPPRVLSFLFMEDDPVLIWRVQDLSSGVLAEFFLNGVCMFLWVSFGSSHHHYNHSAKGPTLATKQWLRLN